MKNTIIFSGTTEGRTLSKIFSDNKIPHIVSVATDYGKKLCETSSYVKIKKGRMDALAMMDFFKENDIELVVDATHPYAKEVTKNIREAAEKLNIKYMRYVRPIKDKADMEVSSRIKYFEDAATCAKALYEVNGNILLTTGSKELSVFCSDEGLRNKIVARVLPGAESISLCEKNGLLGRQIIAMQGPFSYEMNLSTIKQFDIACMVTKQSGRIGGFEEKYLAAVDAGIDLYIIGYPDEEGDSLEDICKEAGIDFSEKKDEVSFNISLVGCGMGNDNSLTIEAQKAIEEADIILGAERLIKDINPRIEKRPYYLAKDIIPYLENILETGNKSFLENKVTEFDKELNVAILFSGDTGFYSGSQKLYTALSEAVKNHELNARIRVLPGISSVSYLAARLNQTWNNAGVISIHGRKDKEEYERELKTMIRKYDKTYVLVSGKEDIRDIAFSLHEDNLNECIIYAGYRLSYEDEEIIEIKGDLKEYNFDAFKEGLYTVLIINNNLNDNGVSLCVDNAIDKSQSDMNVYFKDDAFKRGNVPMTKEEIRALSIAKLGLKDSSLVYDIGSGTGSVAIQMAAMSKNIKVYAIEKNPEAVSLIRDNCKLFGTDNVSVVEGDALSVMDELDIPTHAFIGGSGGSMRDILKKLYEKNPHMSVVINAVSTETMQLCLEIEKEFKTKDFSMVFVGVTRLNQVGSHHMMKSENPIWICSFEFED